MLVVGTGPITGQKLLLQPDQFPGIGDVGAGVVAVDSELAQGCLIVADKVLGRPGSAVASLSQLCQHLYPGPQRGVQEVAVDLLDPQIQQLMGIQVGAGPC